MDARMRSRMAAAGLVAVTVGGMVGCVGYTAAPKDYNASVWTDPNAPATRDVGATAMRWVVHRFPPEGGDGRLTAPLEGTDAAARDGGARFIVNAPKGMRYEAYLWLVRAVGHGAAPVTPSTQTLPAYHLGRVYVMGDQATVDIIRPVPEMGKGPDGKPVYQGITVTLRGGLKPWTYVSHQTWSMGSMPALTLNYLPASRDGVTGPREEAVAQPNEPPGN